MRKKWVHMNVTRVTIYFIPVKPTDSWKDHKRFIENCVLMINAIENIGKQGSVPNICRHTAWFARIIIL